MLARELYELRSILKDRGIILAYSGYVTGAVLSGVGDALKQKLAIDDADTKTIRSVFAVFVEQMQNIIRYSAEVEPADHERAALHPELRYGVLTIGRSDSSFTVAAGNLILRDDMSRLSSKLAAIRDASKDTLRIMYKETLKSSPDEGSKGAGVGFIEIARRATRPIEFDFHAVDETFTFFALRAEIGQDTGHGRSQDPRH